MKFQPLTEGEKNALALIVFVIVCLAFLVFCRVIVHIVERVQENRFRKSKAENKFYIQFCFSYWDCNFIDGETKHSKIVLEGQYIDWQSLYNLVEIESKSVLCSKAYFREIELYTIFYTMEFLTIERERSILYIPCNGSFVTIRNHNANDLRRYGVNAIVNLNFYSWA
ncbi:MAG: hypothetical protein IJ308_08460 [Clostridia bacterium]|nr:hypothetical protein [Clostridia bacterium]